MSKYVYFLFIVLMLPIHVNAQEPMMLAIDKVPLIVKTANDKVEYQVEIAKTAKERERGLMFRQDFPFNRAMLFKFDTQAPISMWMADTPLSLDMLFLNEKGIIVATAQNTTPYSYNIISSGIPSLYVVELNAGQIKTNEFKAGQRVLHPVIDPYLKEKSNER